MDSLSNSDSQQQDITIITGRDIGAHPFYKERTELDKLSGHDWLMILSLGLASAMGARSLALAIQLFNYPAWLVYFAAVVFIPLCLLTIKMPRRMPRLLATIGFCCALGFSLGFLL